MALAELLGPPVSPWALSDAVAASASVMTASLQGWGFEGPFMLGGRISSQLQEA